MAEQTENAPQHATSFKQSLGLVDATMVVAGSMIGSGIFIVSADITRNVGSAGWLIAVWLITGFMTITAAVSYGELSGMFPKAGGQYVYLKEAYNPFTGFLYGWSFFAVIQTGTIAAVGVAFSKFLAYLVPGVSEDLIALNLGFIKISPAQLVSIALIVFLTIINTRGIKSGKLIQTSFTTIKLLSLFGLIIFGLILMKPGVWSANWTNARSLHKLNMDGGIENYTMIAAMGAIRFEIRAHDASSAARAGQLHTPHGTIDTPAFAPVGTQGVAALHRHAVENERALTVDGPALRRGARAICPTIS